MWARIRAAWRALRGLSPEFGTSGGAGASVGENAACGAAGGLTIVKARAFGKDREFQLVGRSGYHAVGKTCDGGPATMMMLTSSDVLRESLPTFMRFMAENEQRAPEA